MDPDEYRRYLEALVAEAPPLPKEMLDFLRRTGFPRPPIESEPTEND